MLRYIVGRILQALVVVFGVVTLVFVLEHLLPGDQGRIMLGPRATPPQWALYDHENGLDQPVFVQYISFLENVVRGRIAFTPPGFADQLDPIQGVAVDLDLRALVEGPMVNSLILTGLSTVVVIVCMVPLAMYEASRRRTRGAHIANIIAVALYSTPPFLLGTLLIVLLASDLRLLSLNAPAWDVGNVLAAPAGLVLPVLTLSIGTIALFSRYLRSSTMEELTKDYIATARSKGASHARVSLRHALPNSVLPIITLLGTRLPQIFGAQLVVEVLFSYPGMGLALWNAAVYRDFYTMLGAILIGGVLTVVGSLITDLLYAAVDPRIKYV
ncbi:MAG TPA: ABC transporter permease [Candidatus Acidoferrales bacterium]|nr:ABC transporter permease [Candidatus Acidoferrales bacterium]